MNEAAAQICRLVPAMLTRRDELFPLARQVVRDSGYQYSKGHSRYGDNNNWWLYKICILSIFLSRSTFSISNKLFNGDDGPFKRMRFSEDNEKTQWRRVSLLDCFLLKYFLIITAKHLMSEMTWPLVPICIHNIANNATNTLLMMSIKSHYTIPKSFWDKNIEL